MFEIITVCFLTNQQRSFQEIQNMTIFSNAIFSLFITIIYLAESLHIHPHLKPNHYQQINNPPLNATQNTNTTIPVANPNATVYLTRQQVAKNMKQQMNEFQGKISQFNTYASNAENRVNQQTDILERIKIYESLIIHQRDQLYLMSAKINLPLKKLIWVCQQIPSDQRSMLIKKSNDLKLKIKVLNNTIMGYDNITEQKSLGQQIKLANQYNEHFILDFSINSSIVTQQPIKIKYKPNLLDKNWILGAQTLPQLNQKFSKNIQNNQYLVNCPQQTPYVSFSQSASCINCPPALPYFDLHSGYCSSCQQVKSEGHICLDKPIYNNSNLQFVSKRLLLPQFSQLSNFFTPTDVPCPKQTPFYNGKQCIQCDNYFDISKKVCVSCQSNQYYNSQKYRCQQKSITATNFTNISNVILPVQQSLLLYQQKQTKLDQAYKVTYCPKDHPFFNEYECISCEKGLLFSITYKTCGTCPDSQFYNNQTYHCQSIVFYSNLNNQKWLTTNKTAAVIHEQINKAKLIKGSKECPSNIPFYNKSQCIVCKPLQYFSYDTLKCTSCQNGYIFSKNLHKCLQPEQGYFQTNPSLSLNLLYDGRSKNEWVYSYHNNLNNHPQISDCPFEKPYFDGVSCISCPQLKPYFNLGQLLCEVCPQNTTYISSVHECLMTEETDLNFRPTLDKLIAGVFS